MSNIELPCSEIWKNIEDETIQIDVDWSGLGAVERKAFQLAGFTTNDKGVAFSLKNDLAKICPNSKLGQLLKYFKPFNELTCQSIQSYVDKDKQIPDDLRKEIKQLCPSIIKSCQPTICMGKESNLEIKCDDITNILKSVLEIDSVKKAIKSKINIDLTPENICDSLQKLVNSGNDPSSLILNALKGVIKYPPTNDKLNQAIKCVCPNLKPVPSPPPPSPPNPNNPNDVPYNKINIIKAGVLGFICYNLLFFLILIISHVTKKYITHKFLLYIGLFLLTVIILAILVKSNPNCYFKTCLPTDSTWKPIEGEFTGSYSLLGITINVSVSIRKDNTAVLNKIDCSGKSCPFSDLTQNCKDKIVNLALGKKSIYGYALQGECIDEIYKFNSGGKQTITGLWLSQTNGQDLELLVSLYVPVLGKLLLNVPLKRVKDMK